MKSVESKREYEKHVVGQMISLYCRKNHGGRELCPDCQKLLDYAVERINKCPFMETKTFCSNCKVHCFKPQMREEIRKVMRFAGPRMLFIHPVLAVKHLISCKKEKRELKKAKGEK